MGDATATSGQNRPPADPAARTIARLLTIGRDRLSKSETIAVAAVEDGVPLLIEAREISAAFQAMIRKRALDTFDHWMEQAKSSLIRLRIPREAVQAF
jgi:hypothetical protein